MATSGSTDWTLTSRGVIRTALRLIGAIGVGEDPAAEDADEAITHLNMLLKTWGTDPKTFILAETGLTLVAATSSYSLPAARRVVEVRKRDTNSRDTPLGPLSRADYFNLPNKTQQGSLTSWWFDPQRATRTLYVWQVPDTAAATNFTLRYTYQRVIEDIDALDNDADVPQEWLEALAYALAGRLTLPFQTITTNPSLTAKIEERAAVLYDQLATEDQNDASLFIYPDMR